MEKENGRKDDGKNKRRVFIGPPRKSASFCQVVQDLSPDERYKLMYLSAWAHLRVKFDFAECGLVSSDVLLQQSQQRLGLLRAQINSLEVANLDLSFVLLLDSAEGEEKIPDIDAHLHAIGVVLAVIGGVAQLDLWLRRNAHEQQCNNFRVLKGSRTQ
jgi:hypothetical protein